MFNIRSPTRTIQMSECYTDRKHSDQCLQAWGVKKKSKGMG